MKKQDIREMSVLSEVMWDLTAKVDGRDGAGGGTGGEIGHHVSFLLRVFKVLISFSVFYFDLFFLCIVHYAFNGRLRQ